MTELSTTLERQAETLYRRYAYPDWLADHSRLVGRIATVLAARLSLDVATVGLAGYLHDMGRSPLVADDPREHGELSALILSAEGLGACAEAARRHPVYSVLDPATAPRTLEERAVFYADRRGGMRIHALEERISETAERHPRYADSIERSRPAAREIERDLFARLPFAPGDLEAEVAKLWP